jgi:hypothetical protein
MTIFDDMGSIIRGNMSAHSDPSKQIGRGSAVVRSSFSDAGRFEQGMLRENAHSSAHVTGVKCHISQTDSDLRPMHVADLAKEPRKCKV